MRYLVDTNVLSEPLRKIPNANVIAWLNENADDFGVSAIVLGELRAGILAMPVGARRDAMEVWFETTVLLSEILPWDIDAALRWALLVTDMRRAGSVLPNADSMLAASALSLDLIVVTRNVKDFERAGVPVLNPFT